MSNTDTKIQSLIDIAVVFGLSALAFVAESYVDAQGWITVEDSARGISAVLIGAVAAVAMVLIRGGSLREMGFRRPKRWVLVPLQVVLILAAFVAGQMLAPVLVSSFFEVPQPDMSRYDIAGDLGAAIAMALLLPITASIPEEIKIGRAHV